MKLENNIMFLSETLNSIKKLFTPDNTDDAEFKVVDSILSIEESLKSQLESLRIIFEYKIDKDIEIFGNQNLFLHVLSNIIQNSIDQFTSSIVHKRITLTCLQSKNLITLKIQDNAGGINMENINDIFNPFTTTKPLGTGVGLSLSKNIIESKLKGSIKVENKNDGALFIIIFKATN